MTTAEAKAIAAALVASRIKGWLEAGGLTTFEEMHALGTQAEELIEHELNGICITMEQRAGHRTADQLAKEYTVRYERSQNGGKS